MDDSNDRITVAYTGTRAPGDPPERLRLLHRPLLKVTPISVNIERLGFLTSSPAGIVLYSRNAIRSLRQSGSYRTLTPFDRHTWWTVGKKTAQALHREFGVRARFPDDQCFAGLKFELADAPLPDRIVAFSLEGKERDLAPVLAERGIEFVDIPVYRTDPVDYENPSEVTADADWLVFTSSKGVRALFEGKEPEAVTAAIEGTAVATIGPKTAETVREFGLAVEHVPDEPDPDALLEHLASTTAPGV